MLRILYYWGTDPLTMRQVAFWLEGCKPSNHLLKILHEMESDKLITSKRQAYRPNATKLQWSITPLGETVVDTLYELEGTPHEI